MAEIVNKYPVGIQTLSLYPCFVSVFLNFFEKTLVGFKRKS